MRRSGRGVRVLVDATAYKPASGGLGSYIEQLLPALAAHDGLDVYVAANLGAESAFAQDSVLVSVPRWVRNAVGRAAWRERELGRLASRIAADVLLCPTHELPLRSLAIPTVCVVHDIGPLAAPQLYPWRQRIRFRLALKRICQVASAIVCVSAWTKDSLERLLPSSAFRSTVIPSGPQFMPDGTYANDASPPYALYVGALYRHKNVATLIRAFASGRLGSLELRLAGPLSRNGRQNLASWEAAGLMTKAKHEGFVSQSRLRELYASCAAVVLPSLYEGFGLTALESLYAGKPLVASELPSVREIAGDAAVYVRNPTNPDAWVDAIGRVASGGELQDRLCADGLARARRYSWDRTADDFGKLLHSVVEAAM